MDTVISDWDVEGVFPMSTVLPNYLERNYNLIFFLGLLTQETLQAKVNLKNLTQIVLSELGTAIPVFMAEEVDVFSSFFADGICFLTAGVSYRSGLQGCGRAVMCLTPSFGSLEGHTLRQLFAMWML